MRGGARGGLEAIVGAVDSSVKSSSGVGAYRRILRYEGKGRIEIGSPLLRSFGQKETLAKQHARGRKRRRENKKKRFKKGESGTSELLKARRARE